MALTILDAEPKYNIELSDLDDLEFDGNLNDYPDFTDVYITAATETKDGKSRELTDEELEWIHDEYPDWVYDRIVDYVF
tara:strand:+ start:2350 stop:2586 length:237 start_codon:yes stop_codon:yes gene_type:complete